MVVVVGRQTEAERFNSMIQQRYQFPQMAGRLLLTYMERQQGGNQNHPWDRQSGEVVVAVGGAGGLSVATRLRDIRKNKQRRFSDVAQRFNAHPSYNMTLV